MVRLRDGGSFVMMVVLYCTVSSPSKVYECTDVCVYECVFSSPRGCLPDLSAVFNS